MYCSKCGTELTDADKTCPKCGKININYIEHTKKKLFIPKLKTESPFVYNSGRKKTNHFKHIVITGSLLAICIAVFLGIRHFRNLVCTRDKVVFTAGEVSSFSDDKSSYFINGQKVVTYDGAPLSGKVTPDRTKYIILQKDKKLKLYDENTSDGYVISEDSTELGRISNTGVYYGTGEKNHLYYYDFSTNESTDIGYEDMSLDYSNGGKTVVAINDKGEMFSFSPKNKVSTFLCNTGADASICCIADDGSNVVWNTKNGNTYNVYMMKNGAPERIGKLTNSEEFSGCYGYFYNNDRSFIVFSANSAQMILANDGDIVEINLPGVKTHDTLLNRNGLYIDSDDDYIDMFYIAIAKSKDSSLGQVYKMTPSGELTLEVDNINLNNPYTIRNGYIYYMNKDNDLIRKKLGDEKMDQITTDVTDVFVSPKGKYVYLVKSNGLYYWDTADDSGKLSMITSSFASDYKLYVTDKEETVFYISDMKEIEESYENKGTAYSFTVGKSPEKISDGIMDIFSLDTQYLSVAAPLFRKYISNADDNYIVEYGTVVDGVYKKLITNIKY